jgi:hypothetical protein
VSFKTCDPPALTLCFASCYDVSGIQRLSRHHEPEVLRAAEVWCFWLLCLQSRARDFISPPYPGALRLELRNFAVLPVCDDDNEHFLVVFPDLRFNTLVPHSHYSLHILHIYLPLR